jgi:hypothetical protein
MGSEARVKASLFVLRIGEGADGDCRRIAQSCELADLAQALQPIHISHSDIY